jgi:hydrophobe/amphiphile efflux-1 (HAE1) family protein
MKLRHYFIDRPRFASVLSILITVVGLLAFFDLPVTQFPDIVPPTINISASYPGATPDIVAETVATPLEQSINGVEGMLYMSSQSTSTGQLRLTVTFQLGTDIDTAQVLVQNRVALAEPRLPEEVRRLGISTQKSSPDMMIALSLISPDETYDTLYLSTYAQLNISDTLARIDGVGNVAIWGASEYSMRVWLDPEKMASLGLTAGDVVNAMRRQNVQVASGSLGEPPLPGANAFQLNLNTQGRFVDAEQFRNVIIKTGANGRITRLRDVARIELGALSYSQTSYADNRTSVIIAMFQRPGSNAVATVNAIKATMDGLARDFPPGIEYRALYNPTQFVEESLNAVYTTMLEAVILVVLVILVFLQSWRAAIIPVIAIPVSLIGTCAVMEVFGFSLNNLTLFGLVLAIGIVVDDAIVVVENIERNLGQGMAAREAARVTMDEVATALISIALVLSAVFVPTAFLGGITGEFFRQFALTIAVATIISAFNSLTLSPALGALLLDKTVPASALGRFWQVLLAPFCNLFNRGFALLRDGYGVGLTVVMRHTGKVLLVFLLFVAATVYMAGRVPAGFIPQQDQGSAIIAVELPKGASVERTDRVVKHATEQILAMGEVANTVQLAGMSPTTFSPSSSSGLIFTPFIPFRERPHASVLIQKLQDLLNRIQEASFVVINPPTVRGLGRGGGFKMIIEDRGGRGPAVLGQATREMVAAANALPEVERAFSNFSINTPQYYIDIDRTKAEMLNLPVERIFEALQVYLGSAYVNDFNLLGRSYRVMAQADAAHRLTREDIRQLRARNDEGRMVPLGSVVEVNTVTGPDMLDRYNLYPATDITGSTRPGISSGQALDAMEQLAREMLPAGISFEWTDVALQERLAANVGIFIVPLCVLFVFMVLTAQYESWSLPLAIILIVPLCILFAFCGLWLRGMENNILTKIGFIVLIGLACKNAILIVEFARQKEAQGMDCIPAAVAAAQIRLRPILMTSMAFILGVLPLMLSRGAGAEMRQVLGTTVFSGMLGVTVFGLFFTPVFYVVIRKLVPGRAKTIARHDRMQTGARPDA